MLGRPSGDALRVAPDRRDAGAPLFASGAAQEPNHTECSGRQAAIDALFVTRHSRSNKIFKTRVTIIQDY